MSAIAKTFDLTFRGELQPRRDPKRVKSRLAEYLHIDDPAMLEELFSGQTVYLRQDLDRKSAAEHFRQLSQLGCLVALVASSERAKATGNGVSSPKPDQAASAPRKRETPSTTGDQKQGALPTDGPPEQRWPISQARIDRQRRTAMEKKAREEARERATE